MGRWIGRSTGLYPQTGRTCCFKYLYLCVCVCVCVCMCVCVGVCVRVCVFDTVGDVAAAPVQPVHLRLS